jgi:hypothetical protein
MSLANAGAVCGMSISRVYPRRAAGQYLAAGRPLRLLVAPTTFGSDIEQQLRYPPDCAHMTTKPATSGQSDERPPLWWDFDGRIGGDRQALGQAWLSGRFDAGSNSSVEVAAEPRRIERQENH